MANIENLKTWSVTATIYGMCKCSQSLEEGRYVVYINFAGLYPHSYTTPDVQTMTNLFYLAQVSESDRLRTQLC